MEPLQWIQELSNAGLLWGPFFFAIFFMLVITRTAHSYYKSVNERATPPASVEEKNDYRLYFRISFSCGIVLVFLSVGWWIYAQLQQHTFQGVIVGLKINQQIVATDDELYYRDVRRNDGSGNFVKDYHFAIVRNSPFSSGQAFRLGFYPESGKMGKEKPEQIELIIQYRGETNEKFKLKHSGNTFTLIPIGN